MIIFVLNNAHRMPYQKEKFEFELILFRFLAVAPIYSFRLSTFRQTSVGVYVVQSVMKRFEEWCDHNNSDR